MTTRTPSPSPRLGQETTADAVAAAALAVPGVVRLHPGGFAEVATYLPGRRVLGVRTGAAVTEVHLVVAVDTPVLPTAHAVREAVQRLVTTPVDVYVEDLDQPDRPNPQEQP